jgi:hypothetical protein
MPARPADLSGETLELRVLEFTALSWLNRDMGLNSHQNQNINEPLTGRVSI